MDLKASNWKDLACNQKWESWSPVFGGILRDWSWFYAFQMLTSLGEIQSLTIVQFEQWQKGGTVVSGTEDRSLIQVNVIFNTDSNQVLTLRTKQLFPTGTFQRGVV